ncbi:MAG: hypothetical protein HY929_08395 [Euryarchaeota archaeon]|nr:hypothetical protein [Euryarchaeota archaeon]
MKNPNYVGLDVHKSFTHVTALNGGEVAKLKNFSKEFYNFFESLSKRARVEVAIESTDVLMRSVAMKKINCLICLF